MLDLKKELIKRGHKVLPADGRIETINRADVLVVWNETDLGGWREMIPKFQKMGKRVVLLQHGRRGTSRIFPPFNEQLVSDVVCVWGKNDVKRLTSCGIPIEKIKQTGTTVLNHIKPRVPHTGINVVFSPEHWDVDVVENAIVMGKLGKISGVNIVSKLLENEHNPQHYINPVVSNRLKEGHLGVCVDVLSKADVVVAISESTFELMAEIMDIPVIIADIWIPKACAGDDRYKIYQREYSNACTKVKDMNKLEDAIRYAIKHPEHLRTERKQIGIDDGGLDINSPIDEIIKVICQKNK